MRIALAVLVAWLVLPGAREAKAQVPDNQDRAAVQRVITGYATNVQSGNFAAIEATFGPGIHILTGSSALHSWAEYRDQALQPEIVRFTGLRYTHSGIETTVRGNVAWSNFRWQMAGTSENPPPVLGRGTAILEKLDGQWKIVALHFSK
jgi:ketosteroid isomerase-like protein